MSKVDPLFVQAALIVKEIRKDEEGNHLIGLLDTITFNVGDHTPGDPWPQAEVSFILYFRLRCRATCPPQVAHVELVHPTGERHAFPTFTIEFREAASICDRRFNIQFKTNVEGLYWLELVISGETITAAPFRIFFQDVD